MKPNKFFAAVTAIMLAAANSAIFTPTFCATAEEGTSVDMFWGSGECTVTISVVDIDTGKNIEGVELWFEQNPHGTGLGSGPWNTSDEPVKTFEGLDENYLYAIHFSDTPEEYDLPSEMDFRFDNEGENKEIVIRGVPKNAKRGVRFFADNWTNAVPSEDGRYMAGTKEYNDFLYAYVYDEDGKRFTSKSLGWGVYDMYLPDGKYKIKVVPSDSDYEVITEDLDIAKTAMDMEFIKDYLEFPDKDGFMNIEVVGGKLTKEITYYIRMKPEVVEYTKDGCKVNVSIVDMYTNKPVEGVKVKFITDIFTAKGKKIDEWDTTDEPVKHIKDLAALQWYSVEIVDMPEGYHIDKSTSFNFSKLGDTKDIVIRAVPIEKDKKPNIDITVYDWTDLVVDPADGTYEGYRVMDQSEYTLQVYTDEYGSFDATARDIHLPDGKYSYQVFFGKNDYMQVDEQGYKARAVRKIFGKDFVIPKEDEALSLEIKDGVTVGQPCLFVESWNKSKTNCTLDLKVIDGVTGKPFNGAEYRVVRLTEENEEKAEELGIEATNGGLIPAEGYGVVPESGTVTVNGLEPYVKYAVIANSENMSIINPAPRFITFDKDGDKKEVTMKLYHVSETEGCFVKISVLDAETGKTPYTEFKIMRIPEEYAANAEALDISEIENIGVKCLEGETTAEAGTIEVNLEPNATYAVMLADFAEIYNGASPVIVRFDDSVLQQKEVNITLTPFYYMKGDANCDGQVDMSDVVLIMQSLANPDKYGENGTAELHITEYGKKNGDTDGDGLTVGDAQHIQLYLLNKVDSLSQ
ncbi:MAG: dockerin type I repeat-containing protein [Ruminococcus sp.]|uniref:dockerin type I repeat-containing protein n=1 Tax=Ruminococcus sp. TaxID=41978 RepID=UPI0025E9E36A|nr:dockerin type I repeat-containing protein [Ruminococcus sp.]MCR4795795.1 dockerin type I repeat-containing protein [Ruminococcus sp.]